MQQLLNLRLRRLFSISPPCFSKISLRKLNRLNKNNTPTKDLTLPKKLDVSSKSKPVQAKPPGFSRINLRKLNRLVKNNTPTKDSTLLRKCNISDNFLLEKFVASAKCHISKNFG